MLTAFVLSLAIQADVRVQAHVKCLTVGLSPQVLYDHTGTYQLIMFGTQLIACTPDFCRFMPCAGDHCIYQEVPTRGAVCVGEVLSK